VGKDAPLAFIISQTVEEVDWIWIGVFKQSEGVNKITSSLEAKENS
jgi:hypothetical protein